MSDSSIPPAPPQSAVQPTQSGLPTVIINADQIEQIPQDLIQARRAAQIEAIVIRQNLETQETLLRTTQGEIRVRTSVPLPVDRPVILYIPAGPHPPRITLTISDLPAIPAPQSASPPPSTASIPDIPIEAGAIILARFISPTLNPVDKAPSVKQPPTVSQQNPRWQNTTQNTPQPAGQAAGQAAGPLPKHRASSFSAIPNPLRQVAFPTLQNASLIPNFQPRINISILQAALNTPTEQNTPLAPHHTSVLPPVLENNLLQIARAQVQISATQQSLESQQTASQPKTPQALSLIQAILEGLPQTENIIRHLPPQIQQGLRVPQNIQLHIIRITPPNAGVPHLLSPTPPLPHPLPLNTEITGTVIAQSNRGETIINTPHGNLVLATKKTPGPGTQVTFQARSIAPKPSFEDIALLPINPLKGLTWPALGDALDVLTQQAPAPAQTLRAVLPSTTAPAARMSNTMLFFMSALQSGTIESWLGQPQLQALKQAGRRDIIDRLTADFRSLAQQSTEPLSGEWRALSLPFVQDDQLSQLRFLVRHQQGEEEDGSDQGTDKQTRFLVNLKLSALGPMQIDGLYKAKKLDVIIRTDTPLTERMRHELREKYREVSQATHLTGNLTFHSQRQGWVHIDELKDDVGVVA